MTEQTLREAVARASFEAWRKRMIDTGQRPELATATFADMSESELEFADMHAAAALKTIHQWLTEHGYAVVPRELTEDMRDAISTVTVVRSSGRGEDAEDYNDTLNEYEGEKAYDAMLSAAPASPLMEEGK